MFTIIITVVATLLVVSIGLMLFRKPEKDIQHAVAHAYALHDPVFQRVMGVLMGPAILPGNRLQPLQNGDEIFPAMLEAIRGARRSITFETYIYWSGKIGEQFATALEERARAGVKVHIILDWAGSAKMDGKIIQALRAAGAEVNRYHPLRWYHIRRLNNRTHRKLLVVDGTIGFTGGVGIADEWQGHAQDTDHWRDMHFKVEGPVVAEMQAAFQDNWIKTSGTVLHGEDYFPQLPPAGDHRMHLFVSSPEGGSASMHLMYLLSIAAVERSLDISAAYFIPDELMRDALIAARARGVRIRVVLPDKCTDSAMVRIASKQSWGPLLANGVEFHTYDATMFHCKMLILDSEMVSVGSTNFDMRSFELNDEASLNIYDATVAAQMTKVYETDLQRATPFTLQMWKERPWTEKLSERVIAPIRAQL